MLKEIETIILAGGLGKRMNELTYEKPKPLLEVDGKPILSHIFDNIINAFGSAHAIVALGFRGEDIREFYGVSYGSINISYVHDPRSLETRKRLLLAKDNISSSFLFLAGDVLCHPEQLMKVAELQEKEQKFVFGTISGATLHLPALTHAVITAEDKRAVEMVFPPPSEWNSHQLREMHVAYYRQDFIGLLESAHPHLPFISQIISLALKEGKDFQATTYCRQWYHFTKPGDLQTELKFDKHQI